MIGLFTWASAYLYDTFGIREFEAARVASIFFRFGVGATYSLAVKIAEPYSASISGYLTFVANVGGVISTALIGSLADSLGFQYIFVVFAFLFGRSTILSFYLESHLNEQNDRGG